MSQLINLKLSVELPAEAARIAPVITMSDDVKIALDTGSDILSLRLSRVPAIGEFVAAADHIYVVRSVLHTPASDHAATLSVTLKRDS
jgi:hypothetical protein